MTRRELPRTMDSPGVSVLELLIAVACTLLLAGAVFTFVVTTAMAGRRHWGDVVARTAARRAVASVGEDLGVAGLGVESADAVQRNGQVIHLASSGSGTLLRAVLPVGAVQEVWSYTGPSTYVVERAGAPGVGQAVAAVDQPMRPSGAPLPIGTVVRATRRGSFVELSLAWHASEATFVAAWGRPRAILGVSVREYEARQVGGGVELRRRDAGGSWQRIADGLQAFDVFWILDTDADGVPDARRSAWMGGGGARACAVQLEARVQRPETRLAGVGSSSAPALLVARRWIPLRGC